MAPPKTHSASSSNENSELEGKSNNEPTLSDILAEIRKLNVKQTSHDAELAELSVRFSELEATIKLNKDSSAAVKNDTLSDNESKVSEYIDKPKGPNNFPPRDPLIIPGLKSTWNPVRGLFVAPANSPGPRGKTNLLNLSDPCIDRENRSSWASFNSKSEYIQWLWKHWCELIAESDLDHRNLDSRSSHKAFRSGLKPLVRACDVENLLNLQKIQTALIEEGTPYDLWPQRVCHLF